MRSVIDRDRLATLRRDEEARFVDLHPRSAALAAGAGAPPAGRRADAVDDAVAGLVPGLGRVGAGRPPGRRRRARVRRPLPRRHRRDDRPRAPRRDRGGRERGWRPAPPRCCPSPDAAGSAAELGRRFGLPFWQLAISATDANRFVLRFARHLTGRPRVAVMDWCYHGTVDEALAVLLAVRRRRPAPRRARPPGRRRRRPPPWCPSTTSPRSTPGCPRRRRLPADGAGAHQHRDRAARRGLPRRRSGR